MGPQAMTDTLTRELRSRTHNRSAFKRAVWCELELQSASFDPPGVALVFEALFSPLSGLI